MSARQHRHPPLLVDDRGQTGPTRAVWLFMLSLVIAKIALMVAVLAVDFSVMSSLFLFLTTWFWVIFFGVLLASPISFAYRLRKVKARKRLLEQSEWMVEDPEPEQPGRFRNKRLFFWR